MNFIHQPGAEKRVIDFTTAFAEEAFYFPLFAKPAQGKIKVEFLFAANLYFISQRTETAEPGFGCASGSKDNDGRKMVFKDLRVWTNCAGPTNHHAQIIFCQSVFETHLTIFG